MWYLLYKGHGVIDWFKVNFSLMNPNGAHQTDIKETTIETTQFKKVNVIAFESSVYLVLDVKVTTKKIDTIPKNVTMASF